jgi:hypothetical protein
VDETTPIFDQMLSAWFDSGVGARNARLARPGRPGAGAPHGTAPDSAPSTWPDADPDGSGDEPAATPSRNGRVRPMAAGPTAPGTPDPDRWESAADHGWQAARALAATAPSEYTPAGLPKRSPRQSLLPGSVAVTTPEPSPERAAAAARDAQDVRGRLSSLRDGLHRGRHSLQEPGQSA